MSARSPRRLRTLLIAEGANPTLTSAALVGWSCAIALAKETDAHIVTHWRNREDFLAAGLVEHEDFTAIDTRRVQHLAWRTTKLLSPPDAFRWNIYAALSNLVYPTFERALWKTFGQRLKAGEFDLVHRILPLSPTTASPLSAKLKQIGVPFVIGPLNGGVPWPTGFDDIKKAERDPGSLLRPLYRMVPGINATRQNADAIISGSRATTSDLPKRYHGKCVTLPENAIDPKRFPLTTRPVREPGPLRVSFVGRLVALKGVDMLLDAAIPLLKEKRLELELIGDGPEKSAIERRLVEEGIDPALVLKGWIDHSTLHQHLSKSDLFVFPSIREFGGGAVLEAMALGIPPVVLNHGGPPELVPPGTGHILAIESKSQVSRDLHELLTRYCNDASSLEAMGNAAQEHIRTYLTWEAKARQINEIYRWVLGDREDKPDWGTPLGWPTV